MLISSFTIEVKRGNYGIGEWYVHVKRHWEDATTGKSIHNSDDPPQTIMCRSGALRALLLYAVDAIKKEAPSK